VTASADARPRFVAAMTCATSHAAMAGASSWPSQAEDARAGGDDEDDEAERSPGKAKTPDTSKRGGSAV